MAEGLNRAMLIGNLGSDPELRFTQSNRAVLKFRVATTERYQDQQGEWKEVTHWHNVVLWGKRAEALSKILSKGSKVYIEGRIETRSYDDKDGIKRSITEIGCQNLLLLSGRGEGGGGAPGGGGYGGGGGGGGAGGGGGGRGPGGGGGAGGGGGRGPAPGGGGPSPDDFPPDDFGGAGGNDDDIPF